MQNEAMTKSKNKLNQGKPGHVLKLLNQFTKENKRS